MYKNKNDLIKKLSQLGYPDLKVRHNFISVLVEDSRTRKRLLEDLSKQLGDYKYDSTPRTHSRVGHIIVGDFTVLAKPKNKQGDNAPGRKNENRFVKYISQCLKKEKSLDITICAPNKVIKIKGVSDIKVIKQDGQNGIRGDVVLYGANKKVNLSLKQDNAEHWCKVETYFKARAKKILDKAIKKKQANLEDLGGYYKINPEISVDVTEKDKAFAAFGTDKAKVVKRTFRKQDFILSNKNHLTIKASFIATTINDLKDGHDVSFLIRNDKGRNTKDFYPGLTLSAVNKSRICTKNSKKNVICIKE